MKIGGRFHRVAAVLLAAVAFLAAWESEAGDSTPRAEAETLGEASPDARHDGPCDSASQLSAVDVADDLLADRYRSARFGTVTLPSDPRWNENPVQDPNWEFNFHSLRFTSDLWSAWELTRDARYLRRYEFLLRDWYEDNPRSDPPSRYSWNDHAAARRGIVYACALQRLSDRAWLTEAALLHGRTLADEDFYVDHGNHALNQAIGLLALGCEMNNASWKRLATSRIEVLARESIDAQGATNEQAIGYQWYNFGRYSDAAAHMRACGIRPARDLERRIERMLDFIAFGALPNGEWELVGDTVKGGPAPLPGTVVEYVTSGGTRGTRPTHPFITFRAGFAFVRSGWGERRAFADETAVSVHFGPARRFHGHRDAAALTLYSRGDRILLDPGMYHFTDDEWRAWFRSGSAHNTIDVDDAPMRPDGAARLVAEQHEEGFDFLSIEHRKIPGVTHTRRIYYARELDVMLVEDDVLGTKPRTVRQRWHLHPEARPALAQDGFFTGRQGSAANAWVVQLDGNAVQKIDRGARSPIQGWVSFDYGLLEPSSTVSVAKRGTHVRFFTLIAPSTTSTRSWSVGSFRPRPEGFDLVLTGGGLTERIQVRRETAVATVVSAVSRARA